MRRSIFLAALVAATPVAAFAQSEAAPVQIRQGQTLRDANGARVGTIDRVLPNGSVQIIYSSHFTTIPATTLTVDGGVVKTSLTRKDVAKLH